MRWLKWLLHKHTNWTPTTIEDKIYILSRYDIDVYAANTEVLVSTKNIITSIEFLERLNNINYFETPAFSSVNPVEVLNYKYLYKWYSDNNRTIDNDVIYKWLSLADKTIWLYKAGLTKDKTSKGYKNSIKIKPIISEIENIVNLLLNQF